MAAYQPSGSCNFSRIDNVTLEVQLDPEIFKDNSSVTSGPVGAAAEESVEIILFARNYNVLRIQSGMAGLRFAN